MKDPATPNGRASLAEALLKIARQTNDLHLQARWLTSGLDMEAIPASDARYCEALEALDLASTTMLDLAIGVKLGRIAFIEPRPSEPPLPLFDRPESEPLQLDPPAKLLTFEVLDGGKGQPGHIQFSAGSIEEATAHAAINWPGLEIAEVPWERNLDNPERQKPKARRKAESPVVSGQWPVASNAVELNSPTTDHRPPTTSPAGSKALGPDERATPDPMREPIDWRYTDTSALPATLADMCDDSEILTLGEAWTLVEVPDDLVGLGWLWPQIERLAEALLAIRAGAGDPAEWPLRTPRPAMADPGWVEVSTTDLDEAEAAIEIDDEPAPPPLTTDQLLNLALVARSDMDERWIGMRSQGATDLELRAAISRAFDLGEFTIAGFPRRGGFLVAESPDGQCSFQSGDSPKFWAASSRWEGRPTLESRKLVERVRAVMQIPTEPGGVVPTATKRTRK